MSSPRPVPVESDFVFWTEDKLRISDTDMNGHVNNAAIATFCESGRAELIIAAAGLPQAREQTSALAKVTINYRAELHYPGTVRIGTAVAQVGNSSVTLVQALFEDGECFATSEAVLVFMDRTTRRPVRILDSVRANLLRLAPMKETAA